MDRTVQKRQETFGLLSLFWSLEHFIVQSVTNLPVGGQGISQGHTITVTSNDELNRFLLPWNDNLTA